MGKINSEIIKEIEGEVFHLLDNSLHKGLVFHSKKHTLEVIRDAAIIGRCTRLNEEELNLLHMSALFHDVGYVYAYEGHESLSADYAKKSLQSKHISEESIGIITKSILATKVPQQPTHKIAEILCDADLMHLTYDNFFENVNLLKLEWEIMGIASFSEKEFHKNSIKFMSTHEYHTKYGKEILQPKKQMNIERTKRKIEEL